MWATWWIWMVGALALAIVEVLIPAQIFLGFAVGAALTGLGLAIGVPGLAGSLPLTLVVFAVLSLIAWIVIRRVLGVRPGQVKIWDRDINED